MLLIGEKDGIDGSNAPEWLDGRDMVMPDWSYEFPTDQLGNFNSRLIRHQLFLIAFLPFMVASAITLKLELMHLVRAYLGLSIMDILVICPHSHDRSTQMMKLQDNIFLSVITSSCQCEFLSQNETRHVDEVEFLIVPYTYVLLSKFQHRIAKLRHLFNRRRGEI